MPNSKLVTVGVYNKTLQLALIDRFQITNAPPGETYLDVVTNDTRYFTDFIVNGQLDVQLVQQYITTWAQQFGCNKFEYEYDTLEQTLAHL